MELSKIRARELKQIVRLHGSMPFRNPNENLARFLMLEEGTIEDNVTGPDSEALLKRVAEIRLPFLEVLLKNAIVDSDEREVLARLFVFGGENALSAHSVLEAITLVESIPDSIPPLSSIYPIKTDGFFLFICKCPDWDLTPLLACKPLCDLGKTVGEILASGNADWKMRECPFAVSAVADRKGDGEKHICEDDAWFTSIDTSEGKIKIGATFDGVSSTHNLVNRVWQEVIKQQLDIVLRDHFSSDAALEDTDEILEDTDEIFEAVLTGIAAAQMEMKQILFRSWDSIIVEFPTDKEMGLREKDRDLFKIAYAQQIEKGDDPDSLIKWHFLNGLAATTLELNIILPNGKSLLFRVGDGQSVLMKRDGSFSAIGQRRKSWQHVTNALDLFTPARGIREAVEYDWEDGDKVLIMTDGPGDQYAGNMDKLVGFFQADDSLFRAMVAFTRNLDSQKKIKQDDYALLALRC